MLYGVFLLAGMAMGDGRFLWRPAFGLTGMAVGSWLWFVVSRRGLAGPAHNQQVANGAGLALLATDPADDTGAGHASGSDAGDHTPWLPPLAVRGGQAEGAVSTGAGTIPTERTFATSEGNLGKATIPLDKNSRRTGADTGVTGIATIDEQGFGQAPGGA